MVLKLIKHDEALKDLAGQLKEFFSALTIEQNAYTTPWMERGPRPSNARVNALLN